jgi:predicted component of viral defense system (DUF524 family)
MLSQNQIGFGQERYNSIADILLTGKNKITTIESNYRIIEKNIYDILFKDGSVAVSSVEYLFYGDRTYRATAFTERDNKVSILNLKAYKLVDNEWKLDKESKSFDGLVDFKIEPLKSAYYKIEVSCTFKNSTDNYVRYGLILDREL